jgi:hypothetical protein
VSTCLACVPLHPRLKFRYLLYLSLPVWSTKTLYRVLFTCPPECSTDCVCPTHCGPSVLLLLSLSLYFTSVLSYSVHSYIHSVELSSRFYDSPFLDEAMYVVKTFCLRIAVSMRVQNLNSPLSNPRSRISFCSHCTTSYFYDFNKETIKLRLYPWA